MCDNIVVETDVSRGLYHFSIVGLPDKAVEESKDRICAAIKNSGFDSPKTKNHKITSSLAPAHLKKEGSSFDVPIALSYLHAIGTIKGNLETVVALGELSLSGDIKAVKGILTIVRHACESGFKEIFIPSANEEEVSLLSNHYSNTRIYAPLSLTELVLHLQCKKKLPALQEKTRVPKKSQSHIKTEEDKSVVFEDIVGQETAKRAALIAIAGRHNMLLCGPPGTGKTSIMLRSLGQYIIQNSNDQILFLAYTNRAVDEICEALQMVSLDFLRIGSRHTAHKKFWKSRRF